MTRIDPAFAHTTGFVVNAIAFACSSVLLVVSLFTGGGQYHHAAVGTFVCSMSYVIGLVVFAVVFVIQYLVTCCCCWRCVKEDTAPLVPATPHPTPCGRYA